AYPLWDLPMRTASGGSCGTQIHSVKRVSMAHMGHTKPTGVFAIVSGMAIRIEGWTDHRMSLDTIDLASQMWIRPEERNYKFCGGRSACVKPLALTTDAGTCCG